MAEGRESEVNPPSPKDRFGDTARRITELGQSMSKTEIILAFTFRELEQARRDWLQVELEGRRLSICSDIGHEERIYELGYEAKQAGLEPDLKPEDMGLFPEEDMAILFTPKPKTIIIAATGKRHFPTILSVCPEHRKENPDLTEIERDAEGRYTLYGEDVTEEVKEGISKASAIEAVYNYFGLPVIPRPPFAVKDRLRGAIDTKIYALSFDPNANTWSELRSKL
ncbi:MAG: hypothetical protein A3A51_02060 [Candidatus Levybacteria bacterium RIFCSPLOWO2_01_FULL_39_10]|nr:MAG: hypothetical protein A3A51_02060 [Candidatus Levybacteria bacterium RIFCSPLOWO2_01_FULL_39_10]